MPNTTKTKPWLNEPKPISPELAKPADPNTLRIIPLGGCDGIGRNMTVIEQGNDILIIDMGLQFPEESMPGIDYIIPNISYLRSRAQNIRAVIFTHGHLDHIGAVPHLLEALGNPPLVATPLTMALIKRRLDDFKFPIKKLRGHQVRSVNERLTLGKFQVEFFATSHTIMDSIGVIVKSPFGTVVQPGDWKFEDSPKIKHPVIYDQLAERLKGQRSIMLLDSTGATKQGHQMAESEITDTLDRMLTSAKGRVIMATFSSMLERINLVLQIAEKAGKKVAFDGFSMKANVAIAKQLGYLKFKPTTIIDVAQTQDYPDGKVIIMCTGAQGEERASLMRIANGDHRFIKLQKTDTVIFSSSVIPGNERTVQRLKDALYRQAGEVYHNELMDVHAGGHAMAGDIALMLQLTKPAYVMPTHGNYYMLVENGKTAMRLGWSPDHVLVPDDGQVVSFDQAGGKVTNERVPAEHVFVDGLGVGDVSHIVLRDRQALASN
jgi:ribonuclease J